MHCADLWSYFVHRYVTNALWLSLRGSTHIKFYFYTISPPSILFEDDSPGASVKLIDFGLATKYLSNEYKYMRERVGTVYTMSPQVIQGRYGKSCDLWSIGVVTYMLLSGGQMPFPGKSRSQIVKMIMQCKFSFRGEQWSKVSKEAKDFIASLLQMDPLDRPSAEEALKSKWMKKQFPPGAQNTKLQPSDRLDAKQRLYAYGKETKLKRVGSAAVRVRCPLLRHHATGMMSHC